jgi:ubiquinone/menaquinone biosynthesis C-methylase UbiE
MSNSVPTPTPERLMQLTWGYAPPLILEAAVKHGFFDLLDRGPRTAEEVSNETSTSLRGARIVLDALVGLEFLAKDSTQRYALTLESATFLVSTKPGYRGGMLRHITKQLLPQWMQLTEIVRTGQPTMVVNEQGPGAEFFEEFVEDLFPMGYLAAQRLGQELGLPGSTGPKSVLDLATGSGVWGVGLAQSSPNVRVTAVDWPGVLPATRRVISRFDLTDRFHLVPGDLMEVDFGSDHDIATLGHILHSEGAERSRELLKKTFNALRPGGTIAIAEFVPNDERTGPPMPLIFAVNMLVNTTQGDVFTFGEISAWLREAGFVNPRQLEAPAPSPLILATKP